MISKRGKYLCLDQTLRAKDQDRSKRSLCFDRDIPKRVVTFLRGALHQITSPGGVVDEKTMLSIWKHHGAGSFEGYARKLSLW